jgi:putative restriction endonuclease
VHGPFIALTDKSWFDFLSSRAAGRPLDEVNFWSPKSTDPLKSLTPGEPVFFRLKSPIDSIAGYGFFAHFSILELREAWRMFGDKNGDPDEVRFLERIGRYRRVDLLSPSAPRAVLGCTILRDAVFWPRERWRAWGSGLGWSRNIVRGKTETNPARASLLLAEIQFDSHSEPEEFADRFELMDADEREIVLANGKPRIGQGTFRSRLLDAYDRRCAITGERTEPVLDAAHVQPYLGPRSNHLQNGLLLTKEFHTLFDLGLLTVTPEYVVKVSSAVRENWSNGKRYYEYDDQKIRLPAEVAARPSAAALEWHGSKRYRS